MPHRARSIYHSYLLRLWCHDPSAEWRASVQDVRTGQMHYFARVEDVWAFIQVEMATQSNELNSQAADTVVDVQV